jgi:hypothetical protein
MIRQAYLCKPIHRALWFQLTGVRLGAAHRSVDLMPSNDIAQVKGRPNGYVALTREQNLVQAKQADNSFREFRAFDPCRLSVAPWGLANGSGNRDGELFGRSAADEIRCCDDCGVLILVEGRVADHVGECPSKRS